jgi:hypothetical protein
MHRFDLLLFPLSENEFSTDVKVICHQNDEYFKKCDLSSWVVKYDFENNAKKYLWADTENGKGVIFYMKDEFNNECYYDFKNIMFERWSIFGKGEENVFYGNVDFKTGQSVGEHVDFEKNEFYYTFSTLRYGCQVIEPLSTIKKNYTHLWVCDMTVEPFILPNSYAQEDEINHDFCVGNKINPFYNKDNKLMLNNNVFIGQPSYWQIDENNYITHNTGKYINNTIANNCYGNTFCGISVANVLEHNCLYNVFNGNNIENYLKSGCKINSFLDSSNQNKMEVNCKENVLIGSCNNVFENNCIANVLKKSNANKFSFGCVENILTNCSCNTFSTGCRLNKLVEATCNRFGEYCINNVCEREFSGNVLGCECLNNTFGEKCHDNVLYNKCSENKFGDETTFNWLRGNNYFILIDRGVSYAEYAHNICGKDKENLLDNNLEPGVMYKQSIVIDTNNEIRVITD